jgi:hypothetical protein
MNNQQIKDKLLELADVPDFSVILSGKKSKKVDGLYKPASREIIIHNKNMKDDDDTMYTAIHEFAHHVQCSNSAIPASGRCHTRNFWATFHNLLEKAETKGVYRNVFKKDDEFLKLTKRIKENYIKKNGELMKELGSLLAKVKQLCYERHLSFDDYTDRELGLHRTIAEALIKVHGFDISPDIGFENMKTVALLRSPEKREEAENYFINNASPDTVKEALVYSRQPVAEVENPVNKLLTEKNKIIKTIATLEKRLIFINEKLDMLEENNEIGEDISKNK